MITIRELTASDQAYWTEIGTTCNASHPEYLPSQVCWPDIEDVDAKGNAVYLVAEKEGVPVGRMSIRDCYLMELAVRPDLRRQGIGTRLLEEGMKRIAPLGVEQLIYCRYVDDDEEGLMTFFVKNGFSYSPSFSREIDLRHGILDSVAQKSTKLLEDGFTYRIIRDGDPFLETITALHDKYFPGFPGFMSVADTIKTMHRNGMLTILVEKESSLAGFVIGGTDMSTRNYRHVRKAGCGLLSSIAVCEDFRGHGLGILLGYLLLKECLAKGNERLVYGGCQYWGTASWNLALRLGGQRLLHHYTVRRTM